jgi:hypothetical protein
LLLPRLLARWCSFGDGTLKGVAEAVAAATMAGDADDEGDVDSTDDDEEEEEDDDDDEEEDVEEEGVEAAALTAEADT